MVTLFLLFYKVRIASIKLDYSKKNKHINSMFLKQNEWIVYLFYAFNLFLPYPMVTQTSVDFEHLLRW